MTDTRERARLALQRTAPCTHDMVGDEDICDGCKYEWEKSLVDRIVAFASSEAALARKQEREACAKAVCPSCAMPERFDPPQGNACLMTHHERGSGGIATCRAAAIHERNLAETGGTK